jgi:hypothetical protein
MKLIMSILIGMVCATVITIAVLGLMSIVFGIYCLFKKIYMRIVL